MTAEELLDEIEALLVEERDVLVRLQARRVEELAAEKERLFEELRELARDRQDLRPRLVETVRLAHRNCLLLAFARDSIGEALGVVARNLNGSMTFKGVRTLSGPMRGLRVSVSG